MSQHALVSFQMSLLARFNLLMTVHIGSILVIVPVAQFPAFFSHH